MKHKVIKSGFSFFYTNLNGHVEAGHRRSHNLNMLQNPEKRLRLFILQKCTMNVELGIRLAWKASAIAYHLRGQIIRRFFSEHWNANECNIIVLPAFFFRDFAFTSKMLSWHLKPYKVVGWLGGKVMIAKQCTENMMNQDTALGVHGSPEWIFVPVCPSLNCSLDIWKLSYWAPTPKKAASSSNVWKQGSGTWWAQLWCQADLLERSKGCQSLNLSKAQMLLRKDKTYRKYVAC